MTDRALDLRSTYFHLGEGADVTLVPVTADFWATIDQRHELQRGRLMTSFHQADDWDVWEMHPDGDEIVLLLSGAATMHLEGDHGTRIVELAARSYVVVPTNTWHTVDVHEPGDILVITWGAGTQHRPR